MPLQRTRRLQSLDGSSSTLAKAASLVRSGVRARLIPKKDFDDNLAPRAAASFSPLSELVNTQLEKFHHRVVHGPEVPCPFKMGGEKIYLELEGQLGLPLRPSCCRCMNINYSVTTGEEGDDFCFVDGHLLHSGEVAEYLDCVSDTFFQLLSANHKEEKEEELAQWIAEMLVAKLCLVQLPSSGFHLLAGESYTENEERFKMFLFLAACDGVAKRTMTCSVRATSDGRRVKLSHVCFGADCEADPETCPCAGCCSCKGKRRAPA